MTPSRFLRLFRYTAWANQRALDSVRDTPAAHDEAIPLLAHLLAAEHVWLARLNGRPPRHAVWPTLSLDECDALLAENELGYRDFIANLSEADMNRPVPYRTTTGQEFVTPVFDILTQVLTHGPYHRGQIARIIGRAGGKAPGTDYIVFVREQDAS